MDDGHSMTEEPAAGPGTPEDVAILYSWANLPGAKYRDFSASRREYRAQQRARAAEAQRQTELAAARKLEEDAQREIEEAQRKVEETEHAAQAEADEDAKRRAEEELRLAEERAQQERQEILKREQTAEDLRQRAERAREEMLDARKRAEEQAARYAEADAQYHAEMERDREGELPGEITDPYYYSGPVDPAYFAATPGVRTAQAARTSLGRKPYTYPVQPGSEEYDAGSLIGFRRSSGQFAPAQGRRLPSSPLREAAVESVSEHGGERIAEAPRTGQEGRAPYSRTPVDRTSTAFSQRDGRPSQPVQRDRTSELHIRPAMLAGSDDQNSYQPPLRRAPLPNLTTPVSVAVGGPRSDMRRDSSPMREVPSTPETPEESYAVAHGSPAGGKGGKRVSSDPMQLSQLRFESNREDLEENSSSRIFHPKALSRMSQPESWEAPQTASPLAEPGLSRDAAVRGGDQRAFSALVEKSVESEFVRNEVRGGSNVSEQTLLRPRHDPHEGGAGEITRMGDPNARRRRDVGASLIARTVRQPRLQDAPASEQFADQNADGPAASPAWLSSERGFEPGPGLPRSFAPYAKEEDSAMPLPRAVSKPAPAAGSLPRDSGIPYSLQNPFASSLPNDLWQPTLSRDPSFAPNASDTLQQSRERVASRWFALSGLMGTENRDKTELRPAPRVAPNLCVLSISGGVGKTSIVATLGRALSSLGEKVLLVDTNVHGILPYYFGAREPRPGTVRTFAPPPGSVDAPVVLVSYDADGRNYDDAAQTRVLEDLARRSQTTQRVLLDVSIGSAWLARKLAQDNPWILVPVAPDMNSVLGTQAVERLFQDVADAQGRVVKPYYVLNQYDPSLPLHLDVREVLRQFLGDRLLPMMLHRTPAVSEALAEGMTVIDYAAGTPIAQDYMNLAAWVRGLSDPGASYASGPRWSER